MGQKGRPQTPMSERIAAMVGVAANGVKPSPLQDNNPFDQDMDEEAWRLWKYLVPELIGKYSVGHGDQPIIEAMCLYYQRAKRARLEYGTRITVEDAMGTLRIHPALKVEDLSWQMYDKLAAHLGLNPVDRNKIKGAKLPDVDANQPFTILSFDRDRTKGPPPPDGAAEVQDAG